MGITFEVNSLEKMCDAMCDNVVPKNRVDRGRPHGVYCRQRGDNMNKESERSQRYQNKAIRRFMVKVNRFTESDILERLEGQESVQGYIKRLIREDIERNK